MFKDAFSNQNNFRKIKFKLYEENLAKLYEDLTKSGFQSLLIKGWAIAQYYPNPFQRNLGDVDLVFSPESVDRKLKEIIGENPGLACDIHKGFRLLDTVSFEKIYRRAISKNCYGIEIKMPCPEDHLRILCAHWMHDGGAYREKIWDIYYLLEKSKGEFSWNKCLEVVDAKRKKWIVNVAKTVQTYSVLDNNSLPPVFLEPIPDWFIETVESEWEKNIPLVPLYGVVNDRKKLLQQISKRIPPNPIQVTIETNSEIENKFKFSKQIKNIFQRVSPSIKRFRGEQP